MKKFFTALLAVMLLGTVPVFASEPDSDLVSVLPSTLPARMYLSDNPGTLSVSGEGRVKVMPDMALLNIGTTITGETTAVQQESVKVMEKVIAAIKDSGVAEADIKTTSYSLNPRYNYEIMRRDGTYDIVGYSMTHMLEVTVRDIDAVGTVLSNATEAGANENWGVNFTLSNPEEYYGEALALAVKNAEGKAKIIAGTIGVTISVPAEVREGSGYSAPRYNYAYDNVAMAEAAAGAVKAAPVSAGEMEITASVSLTYRY